MSAKYSTSHALDLTIAKSRIHFFLQVALGICVLTALLLLWVEGRTVLAVLLLPPAGLLIWQLRYANMSAPVIRWRQGVWTLQREGCARPVRISSRSIALPWVIYLAWCELPAGPRGCVWVFADSAPPQQLRCLRVRLSLQQ